MQSPGGGGQAAKGAEGAGGAGVSSPAVSAHWLLPPGIRQYFAPARGGVVYTPMIAGAATVRYTDSKAGLDATRPLVFLTPLTSGPIPVDWEQAEPATFRIDQLSTDLPAGATFEELPPAANKADNYDDWSRAFIAWLSSSQSLAVFRSPSLAVTSNGTESEGDFRARLQLAARERRDQEVDRLRQKYAPKSAAIQERLRRAQQARQREEEQASGSKIQAAISIGTSILGGLLGRKTLSSANVGRMGTAARGVERAMKQSSDVSRAAENVAAVQAQLDDLNAALASEIATLDATYDPLTEALDSVTVKPKRGGITVQLVALTWKAKTD